MLGGFIGLMVGIIGGGYLGLVVGWTFLGAFDIYDRIGIEGYELAAYVRAIIGAIVMTRVGMKIALNIFNQKN